jgi:hypothetical protein
VPGCLQMVGKFSGVHRDAALDRVSRADDRDPQRGPGQALRGVGSRAQTPSRDRTTRSAKRASEPIMMPLTTRSTVLAGK